MKLGSPSAAAIPTAVALVALAGAGIWYSTSPPPPGPAPETTDFSTVRALELVEELAERPHPMGSAEHERVRAVVARTLADMGLSLEHQQTTTVRMYARAGAAGPIRAGRVHNLLARIPGTDSTGAILLASHYDSVPAGPGAADAASCVAAILEAVRALREGPPLRNDVIVLITDGEEDGLMGAQAFVEEHPWAKDVRLTLNFEARGTTGPSQMFETSPGNGRVVGEWAAATPYPTGSSLGYEIYKRLPNDTDFSVFKRLDTKGLNFAFIDNVEAYHTPLDAPGSLDSGSLYAHGSTALALTRRFGDLDLNALDARDAVFFSLPLGYAVSYSTLWTLPFAVLTLAAWVVIVVVLRRRGTASIGGIVLAAIISAVTVAAAVFAGLRYHRFPEWLHERWLAEGGTSTNAAYALAFVCAVVTVWLAVHALLRRKFAAHSLAAGSALIWVLVSGAAAWYLPGATYVVFWPTLAALVAIMLLPGPARTAPSSIVVVVLWVLAIPVAAVVAPTAASLFGAVGIGVEGGAALAVCTMLALGTLVAQLDVVMDGRRLWPALVVLLAGLGALAAGAWTAPYGSGHPKPVNVVYVLDADAGKAEWACASLRLEPWLEQYLGAAPSRGALAALASSRGPAEYWYAEAPVVDLAVPEAAVTAEDAADGDRLVTLRVTSPRGGRTISLRVADATVVETWIDGRRVETGSAPGWEPGRWSMDYVNPAASGVLIQLRIRGRAPATLTLIDRTHELPAIPGRTFEGRPPGLMTIQNGDMAVVSRTVRF